VPQMDSNWSSKRGNSERCSYSWFVVLIRT
jgi:hypothetical protein